MSLCNIPVSMNSAGIVYILSTILSSHFLILLVKVNGVELVAVCYRTYVVLSSLLCVSVMSENL